MKLAVVSITLLVGALSLTACSGAAAPTTTAVSATSTSGSTPATTPSTAATAPMGTRLAKVLAAAKSGRAKMTLTSGTSTGKPQSMVSSSEFVFDGTKANVRSTVTVGGEGLELLIVDGVSYLKDPTPKAGGKPWMKLDPNGKDMVSVMLGGIVTLLGDPTLMISSGWDAAKVTKVGVEGDLARYQATGLGSSAQAADLWLDSLDRPVKVTATSPRATAGTTPDTMEVVYSDWGAAITVTAPPADQVGPPPSS